MMFERARSSEPQQENGDERIHGRGDGAVKAIDCINERATNHMHAKDYILWSVQPSIICIFVHMPSSLGKLYDLRIIIYYSTHPLNYSPTHIFIDLFSGLQLSAMQ